MDDLNEIAWEITEITPSIAAEMLSHVHASGHVDQSALASFGKDMSAGRWVLNGAPIVLSSHGSLLNGRARLHACVKSKSSFQTLLSEALAAQPLKQSIPLENERWRMFFPFAGKCMAVLWGPRCALSGATRPGSLQVAERDRERRLFCRFLSKPRKSATASCLLSEPCLSYHRGAG